MSSAVAAVDLTATTGYLVADARGRVVGRVEGPMYGTSPDVPDALAVRRGFLRRRRLVPADAISAIDGRSGVIGLRLDARVDPQLRLAQLRLSRSRRSQPAYRAETRRPQRPKTTTSRAYAQLAVGRQSAPPPQGGEA